MQKNKQDEKPVHYEQKSDDGNSDYTPQKTYEPQSTNGRGTSDRRSFLRRTGTAVVVGLGGILFGKTAMAEDIGNDGIDGVVGEEEGSSSDFKKVTSGYEGMTNCNPPCYPNCSPPTPPPGPCVPNCSPCQPDTLPCNPDDNRPCYPNKNCGPYWR